jgi:hypothetical protein
MPFMLAISAVNAIKSGVALYKEAKGVGKEVVGIYTELSDSLGSFFDHQEKAHKDLKEKEKNPPKGKSIKAQALENVIKRKQLQQAEHDLRHALIYDAPPELGALWSEFEAERQKLEKDKAKFETEQKKRTNLKQLDSKNLRTSGTLELQSVLQSWFLRSPVLG